MPTGDGSTPIIVFINGTLAPTTGGSSVLWAPLSNYSAPDVAKNFTPTSNDYVAAHYTYTLSLDSYSYTFVPPVPPPAPSVAGFQTAIWADMTLTNATKTQFSAYLPLIASNLTLNPGFIATLWTALIAVFSGTWLDAGSQTIILGYATTYHIPLT